MFGQNTTDYAVVFTLVGHKDNNADIALSFLITYYKEQAVLP